LPVLARPIFKISVEDVMKQRRLRQVACIGLVVAGLSCKAHENTEEGGRATADLASNRSLSPCPPASTSQTSWLDARSRDGRLTLRLPRDYSESQSGSGDVWFFHDGSVGYRLVPRAQRREDSLSKDSTAPGKGWCRENVDGKMALIKFTYATPATGPGYYLSELLPLDSGRDLRLIGFMRDTLRAQVLLEIARSVRITPE